MSAAAYPPLKQVRDDFWIASGGNQRSPRPCRTARKSCRSQVQIPNEPSQRASLKFRFISGANKNV